MKSCQYLAVLTFLLMIYQPVTADPTTYSDWYHTLPATDAEQRYRAELKQHKHNAELHHFLGRSLFDQGEIKDSLKAFEESVERASDQANYHYHYAIALIERLDAVSVVRQPFIARKAKDQLDQALEIEPAHISARTARFRFLLNAPGIAGGSIDQAWQDAEALAQYDPAQSQLLMARWHHSQEDPDAAIKAYDGAVALRPDDLDIHFQRVVYRVEQGQVDAAFPALNDAFTALESSLQSSDSPSTNLHTLQMQLRYQLGKAAAKWGRELDKAETALRAYLGEEIPSGAPPSAWAWYRLGQVLEHADRPEAAEQAFMQAMNAQPEPELQARLEQRLGKS